MGDDFIPDDDFQPDPPQMQGKPEPTENLLQRAIKGASNVGNAVSDFSEGIADVESFGMNRLGGWLGDKAVQGVMGDKYNPEIQPKEEQTLARGLGQGLSIGRGATQLVKGGLNLFNVGKARQTMSDTVFKGKEKIAEKVGTLSKEANAKFGKVLNSLDSAMSSDDFANVLAETADEIGVANVPGHPVMNMFTKLVDQGKKMLNPREVQMMTKTITQYLGKDEVSKAAFYKKFLEILPDAVPGLKELKAAHAPLFKVIKDAKPLMKVGTLNKIAKGTMGPMELGTMQSAEKNLGTNVIKDLIKSGKNYKGTSSRLGIAKIIGKGGLAAGGGKVIWDVLN